jgi:hypothetical protein
VAVLSAELEEVATGENAERDLAALEQGIRAAYKNVDDRTLPLLTFLSRYSFLENDCGVEFVADIWREFSDDVTWLQGRARRFADDPDLAPLVQAVALEETIFAVAGVE